MDPLVRMWGAITALAIGIAVSFIPQGTAVAKPGTQLDQPEAPLLGKAVSGQRANASTSPEKLDVIVAGATMGNGVAAGISGTAASSQQLQKTHVSRLIPNSAQQ